METRKRINHETENTRQQLVVILMGSPGDKPHADKIAATLSEFGVAHDMRVGSAHKTPEHVLALLREYESTGDIPSDGSQPDVQKDVVFIAVAGRSNALGGFLDANTRFPVISSPPPGEPHTIFSSLDMPSGVGVPTALYPEVAALHAVKIFGLTNPELAARYEAFQEKNRQKILETDRQMRIPAAE